jgi:hypothetical protein
MNYEDRPDVRTLDNAQLADLRAAALGMLTVLQNTVAHSNASIDSISEELNGIELEIAKRIAARGN